MVKILRIICVLVMLLALILGLTSCAWRAFEYLGDDPELYSVAVSSILGTIGFQFGGLDGIQPHISVIREDRFGRILFHYEEGIDKYSGSVIIQKIEGDYAYFYPHYNFIIGWPVNRVEMPGVMEAFEEANSWNQEMSDDSEFERVRISNRKEAGPISNRVLMETYRTLFPEVELRREWLYSRMAFLRTDSYGRSVYQALGGGMRLAILFQPDHSFDIETGVLEITDDYNYQTELRLFMEENGWNTPYYD